LVAFFLWKLRQTFHPFITQPAAFFVIGPPDQGNKWFLIPPAATLATAEIALAGAGNAHLQFPAAQGVPVELLNSFIGVLLATHRYKCKSFRTAGVSVFNERNLSYRSGFGEKGAQFFFGGLVGKISYVYFCFHLNNSLFDTLFVSYVIIKRDVISFAGSLA
jgi:hypothetical protein